MVKPITTAIISHMLHTHIQIKEDFKNLSIFSIKNFPRML